MLGPVLCISKRRILLPKQKEHEAKEKFGFPFYFTITSVIWTTAGLENTTFASPLINNNRNHVNKWSNFNCNLSDTDLPFTSHLSAFFAIPCNNFKHSLFYLRPPPHPNHNPRICNTKYLFSFGGKWADFAWSLSTFSFSASYFTHALPTATSCLANLRGWATQGWISMCALDFIFSCDDPRLAPSLLSFSWFSSCPLYWLLSQTINHALVFYPNIDQYLDYEVESTWSLCIILCVLIFYTFIFHLNSIHSYFI